jgi:hypothetical protein
MDGGNGFRAWRITANILHKQSLTADKGCSSAWELNRKLIISHYKTQHVKKFYTYPRASSDSLDLNNGKYTRKFDGLVDYDQWRAVVGMVVSTRCKTIRGNSHNHLERMSPGVCRDKYISTTLLEDGTLDTQEKDGYNSCLVLEGVWTQSLNR